MSGETKKMFPIGTSASLGGYISPGGELIMAVNLTQKEVNDWNGIKVDEAKSYSNRSSKDDLEEYGRTVGIELDKRKSKKSLLRQLKEFVKK
jgi:hypothetical protein